MLKFFALPMRKINEINMVAKCRYKQFVYILIGLQLMNECKCVTNNSTNSTESIATAVSNIEIAVNNATVSQTIESRKLSDDVIDGITIDGNSLYTNRPAASDLLMNEQITNHDFQYYNEPTTTNGYEPSYSKHHHSPVHHQVTTVHMANPMNKTYFTAPLLTTPYVSANSFVPSGNRLRIVQITKSPQWQSAPSSSAMSSLSLQPQSSSPSYELSQLPYLENQYIASFRDIKSSVMNMIYKVQDFMSYVMSFFTMGK